MNELFYDNVEMSDIQGEIWKDYDNIKGRYVVSNLGRVKLLPRLDSFHNKMVGNKIAKQRERTNGYLLVTLCFNDGRKSPIYVHRLVALSHIGNTKNKSQVNHINGIKKDNRAHNLEWVTPLENNIHANKMGLSRYAYGENNGHAALTNKEVLSIFNSCKSNKELSNQYNVSVNNIRSIKIGKTYSKVTGKKYIKKEKKLPDYVVREIYMSNKPQQELAKMYNILQGYVSKIKRGDVYKKITSAIENYNPPPLRKGYKKFKKCDVIEIFKSSSSIRTLSIKYKVDFTTIWSIKKGKTWQKVTSKIKVL